jgi:hypothetical protein
MQKLLAVIGLGAALAVSCNQPAPPSPPKAGAQPVESMPQLGGDPPVSIRSVKVTGAMPRADALIGLAQALPHVQGAAKQSEAEGKIPSGSFKASFRTEPDGMVRMVLEGENRITGGKPAGVVEGFVASTMGHKWRFPASGGPSLIEVEFVVGKP